MNEEVLYALAQAAMTLAGFSGFVAGFRLRGKNAWSPTELRALWFLIIDSFFVVFLSFLPIPLNVGGVAEGIIWTVCSLLLGIWFVIGNFFAFQGERRERAMKQLIRVPVITVMLYCVNVLAVLVAICLWLSAFDVLIPRGEAVYVGGLITLMAFAALEFLFFIVCALSAKQSE